MNPQKESERLFIPNHTAEINHLEILKENGNKKIMRISPPISTEITECR